METIQIATELENIFRKVFFNKELTISNSTSAKDIDGWDSLTHVELINEIEHYFNIRFSFNEVLSFQDAGALIKSISQHLQSNGK